MPYISFSNWKYGLDTRRSELTSQPGTLLALTDAVVNEGAEIENRKAFNQASVAAASTFGLETVSSGLLTFGSIADPGGWTSPVSYQRLQHPAVINGASFNATYHTMTAVNCSTSFGGNAWVVATFSDGNTYAYYNGTPIYAWYAGTVLRGLEAVDKLATILNTNIAAVSGFHVSTLTTGGGTSYFDFWSDVGLSYAAVIGDASGTVTNTDYIQSVTSGSGTLTVQQMFNNVSAVSGVQATGSFWITGGSTGSVTSIKVNSVTITSGTVNFNTNVTQTAADICSNINSFLSSPDYTASYNSPDGKVAQVVISANVTGTSPNGFVIQVNASGDFCVDNTIIDFSKGSPANGATCTNITPAGGANIINGGPPTLAGTNYAQWAADIATNIRAYSGTSGYTAVAITPVGGVSASAVVISKLVRNSNDSIPATVAVTTSSGTPTDAHSVNVTTNTPINVVLAVPASQTVGGNQSILESLNVIGGTAPYTYLWFFTDTVGTWSIGSPTAASTTVVFQKGQQPATGSATLQCRITDSSPAGNTVLSPLIHLTKN